MIDDGIDSFASMFEGAPGQGQRVKRETRARKERRSQMTAAQLRRKALRTEQVNFRCTKAFKKHLSALAKQRDLSIADLMEAVFTQLPDWPGQKEEGGHG